MQAQAALRPHPPHINSFRSNLNSIMSGSASSATTALPSSGNVFGSPMGGIGSAAARTMSPSSLIGTPQARRTPTLGGGGRGSSPGSSSFGSASGLNPIATSGIHPVGHANGGGGGGGYTTGNTGTAASGHREQQDPVHASVSRLLDRAYSLPCSTAAQAFTQLVQPTARFQVALDAVLPVLDTSKTAEVMFFFFFSLSLSSPPCILLLLIRFFFPQLGCCVSGSYSSNNGFWFRLFSTRFMRPIRSLSIPSGVSYSPRIQKSGKRLLTLRTKEV